MEALINLSGNVGNEVEFTQGDGWAYARFRLASTPRHWREGAWVDGETTWITVRATNRMACNVATSIRKGDPVVVVGRLRTHSWTTAEGDKVDRLVVEAVSLGHDLSRGTSRFIRAERSEPRGGRGEVAASPSTPAEAEHETAEAGDRSPDLAAV